MATVYLWKISSSDKRVGHLALKLYDDYSTYISFWPASGGKSALWGASSTFHSYDEDVEAEGGDPDESYYISSYLLDLSAIRRWWIENHEDYSLFGNNCARTVYLALKAGGLRLFKKDRIATTAMWMRWPDDDQLTYEEFEDKAEISAAGGIEDLPVAPATAFSWIKERVEEEESGSRGSKCICM